MINEILRHCARLRRSWAHDEDFVDVWVRDKWTSMRNRR